MYILFTVLQWQGFDIAWRSLNYCPILPPALTNTNFKFQKGYFLIKLDNFLPFLFIASQIPRSISWSTIILLHTPTAIFVLNYILFFLLILNNNNNNTCSLHVFWTNYNIMFVLLIVTSVMISSLLVVLLDCTNNH